MELLRAAGWRPRRAVAVQLSVLCVHWHCTAAAGLGPLQQPTSEHKTAELIKQSVFKEHKLEHAKEKEGGSGPGKTGEDKAKPPTSIPEPKGRVAKRKEEKQMDFVDLGEESDEDEVTDVTQKKVLEKKLPCPSCDIMFATTMSLKMHMNLSHPVKMEATDSEKLLGEGEAEEDDTDKVMEEMNNLGTSEMLDDLVNFLNEL